MSAYFRSIRFYCLMSTLIFTVVAFLLYFTSDKLSLRLISPNQALLYGLLAVLILYAFIRVVLPLRMRSIRSQALLTNRLLAYKRHLMVKIALANLGSFVVLALVLLSGHQTLILLVVSFILLTLNEWPTQSKLFQALLLTEAEQEVVKSPDFKIAP